MPRYFFHVHDGVDEPDLEGIELANWTEAQQQAVRTAGNIIADSARRKEFGERWSMEVADETGLILFRLEFYVGGSAAILGPENFNQPTDGFDG